MNVITVKRTVRASAGKGAKKPSLSIRDVSRDYFQKERTWSFLAEASLFAIIVAISVCPVAVAMDALRIFREQNAG
jgi:hypothetical protein